MRDKQAVCQALCETLARRVENTQLCCAVDLEGTRLLHVHQGKGNLQARWLETIAASVADLFSGKKLRRLQQVVIADMRAEPPPPDELFIKSSTSLFFLKRIPSLGVAVLLATGPQLKQGLGWMTLRNTVKELGLDAPGTSLVGPGSGPVAPEDERRARAMRFDAHLGIATRAFPPLRTQTAAGTSTPRVTQRLSADADAGQPNSGRVETGRLPEPNQPPTPTSRLTRRPRLMGMGRNLRACRIARGFSIRDLARRLGVRFADLESWEKGRCQVPEELRPALIELIPAVESFL